MDPRNPKWWKRRSILGSGLKIVALFAVLLCIDLANSSDVVVSNSSASTDSGEACYEDICLSPGCIHAATAILKNMDPNVEPCDDFYRFACGGFLSSEVIPDDETSLQNFDITADKVTKQLRTSMEAPIEPNERKPYRLVKNLYNSCVNTTAIEEEGLKPLHRRLKKIGGWPVVDGDEWNEDDFDWISSIYKFRDTGCYINQFIGFNVGPDLKNSTKRLIYLDSASLEFPPEYLLKGVDDEIMKAYHDFMVDIAVLLGADKERASIELKESLLFEMNLANISSPLSKRSNIAQLYNPMTLDELTKNYPSIPWKEYFSRILPKTVTIDENEVSIVLDPSFISKLEELITVTPKRIQANYAIWRVVSNSLTWLNDDVRKRGREFFRILYGEIEPIPRWERCVYVVKGILGLSVSAIYVRNYFDEEAKRNAVDMVKDIKQQFIEILEEAEWMDESTRLNALEKGASITSHIAYPDELMDDNKLEEVYANLELSGEHYFENIVNWTLFKSEYVFGRLHEPVNKSDWMTHGMATTVNAHYMLLENSIEFPAGILQGIFFSDDRPKYMNYGGIGFIIGHELTHAFDDFGRQFDKDGNFVDWWAPSTKEDYLERAQCIIDQYGNYTVKEIGLNLNGKNGLGESIADNGGVKAAHRAYNNWVERNAPEQKLPGLPYSPKQMFWISSANVWCEKMKPQTLKMRVQSGRHSPGEFRVIGPLSNMPEFSKDFNCPIGSKMNPEKKCSVW